MTAQHAPPQRSNANDASAPSRGIVVLAAAVPLLIVAGWWLYDWWSGPAQTIGVEGRLVVEIAGPLLTAAPFTPGDAVSLRIASVEPSPRGHRYDLRYIAYGPGKHSLREHLLGPDGKPAAAVPGLAVAVGSVIPAKHDGTLFDVPATPVDLQSRYSLIMRLLWLLWAAALVPLVMYGRRRRQATLPPPQPPTIEERVRSLLTKAVSEPLPIAEQTDLERLLVAHWSARLNLGDERLSDAFERLRGDAVVGEQLTRVERWLHRRDGATDGETARTLLLELNPTTSARNGRHAENRR